MKNKKNMLIEEKSVLAESILKELKVILKSEQFLVAGSFSLYKIGLVENFGDLDIVLYNPTNETIEILKEYMEKFPAKTKPKGEGYKNIGLLSIFMKSGIKVDVFSSERKEDSLKLENYEISKVMRTIKKKKNCNRIKDWSQLRNISNKFFTEKELINYLDSNPKQ